MGPVKASWLNGLPESAVLNPFEAGSPLYSRCDSSQLVFNSKFAMAGSTRGIHPVQRCIQQRCCNHMGLLSPYELHPLYRDNNAVPGVFDGRRDDETVIKTTHQNPKSDISAHLYLPNIVCRLRQGSATIGA